MPVQLRIVRMGMVCWRVRRQRCRTTHATHCLHPRMTWTSLDLRLREQSCVLLSLFMFAPESDAIFPSAVVHKMPSASLEL